MIEQAKIWRKARQNIMDWHVYIVIKTDTRRSLSVKHAMDSHMISIFMRSIPDSLFLSNALNVIKMRMHHLRV
jgi:hypothetical protein